MSTPSGDNPDQGWSSPPPPPPPGPPPPPPPGPPSAWPPPAGYGQPDYSGIQPHYGTPMGDSDVIGYASWGQRFGALLLDVVFLFVAVAAIFAVAAIVGLASDVLGAIVGVVGYIGVLIWYMLLEAGPYGQTPGKAVLKIRVQKPDGRRLSKGESVGRYFAKTLSGMPLYLGYLWPLWDAQNRTFHDMILDSRVMVVRQSASIGEALRGPVAR